MCLCRCGKFPPGVSPASECDFFPFPEGLNKSNSLQEFSFPLEK